MNKVKENKNLKYSLFFGFYLIFFVVLFILYRNNTMEMENKAKKQEDISIYEIVKESIIDYQNNNYMYKIIVNNQDKLEGEINNPNYNENKYFYFFDLYNLNKLIKNSKLEKKEDNIYYFKISNNELNNIFDTEKDNNDNEIILFINNNRLIETKYDLSNYYGEKAIIEINYVKGDKNENSSS